MVCLGGFAGGFALFVEGSSFLEVEKLAVFSFGKVGLLRVSIMARECSAQQLHLKFERVVFFSTQIEQASSTSAAVSSCFTFAHTN